MRLILIGLLVVGLLSLSSEAAKKKNRGRDRDDTPHSSRQIEDEPPVGKNGEEQVVKQKDGRRRTEKEEKPLKKADDESSSEEEDDKEKDKEGEQATNGTIVIPPNRERRHNNGHHQRFTRDTETTLSKAKEVEQLPLNIDQSANVQNNYNNQRLRRNTQTHPQTGEIVLTRAQELNDGKKIEWERGESTKPDYRTKKRSRRENEHRAEEMNMLGKTQEMNSGKENPIERGESQRPDYRRKNRQTRSKFAVNEYDQAIQTRSQEEEYFHEALEYLRGPSRKRRAEGSPEITTLSRGQELNSGQRLEIVNEESDRPDYRKKNRNIRSHDHTHEREHAEPGHEHNENHGHNVHPPAHNNMHHGNNHHHAAKRHISRRSPSSEESKSEERTLAKAEELNGGERRPVDAQPSQSTMPKNRRSLPDVLSRRVRALENRESVPLTNRHTPGNKFDSRDTEDWRRENTEDYDSGENWNND